MKSGRGKMFTKRKPNVLSIPIGITGIGEETHPTIVRDDDPQYWRDPIDPIEEKIMNIVLGAKVEKTEEKRKGLKLYLNTIINILFNKKKKDKISKLSLLDKTKSKLFRWWIRDTTNDVKDLVNFVCIHGILGAPPLLTLLTIFNVDIVIVQIIRQSIWLTIPLYMFGVGSGYYLFLDVNQALKDVWSKKK